MQEEQHETSSSVKGEEARQKKKQCEKSGNMKGAVA
jgi:hypothetical protein